MNKTILALIAFICLFITHDANGQIFGKRSFGNVERQYQYNPSANGGNRYCYQPNCKMCNRIFGPMPGYALNSDYTSYKITDQPIVNQQSQPIVNQPIVNQPVVNQQIASQPVVSTEDAENEPMLDPTPAKVVRAVLDIIKPRKDQWLYDLGCGDGRIVAMSSKEYGNMAVGIELNPTSVLKAEELVDIMGVRERVLIIEGDVLNFSYEKADIITMYLFPKLMEKVIKKIKPGTIVVSFNHDIPGVKTDKKIVNVDGIDYEFFVWKAN